MNALGVYTKLSQQQQQQQKPILSHTSETLRLTALFKYTPLAQVLKSILIHDLTLLKA